MSAKQEIAIVTRMQAVTTKLVHSTATATMDTREMVLIALTTTNVKTILIIVTQTLAVKIQKVHSTARVNRATTEMEPTA